jgi:hypothetical protein
MSTINVDNLLPVSFGTVNVNGARINGNISNQSFRISSDTNSVQGLNNTVFGFQAGAQLTSGSNANTILGRQAGANLTSGINNTAIGASTLVNSTTSNGNTCVGIQSGALTTGDYNTGIGYNAGDSTTTGNNNVALGAFANQASSTTNNSITLGNVSHNVLRCAVTSITSLSDARDKKDVSDLRAGLEFVKALRPVEFVWDERDELGRHDISDFGFIAQDLKVAQEDVEMADILKLVYDENPEKLEASYGKLIPILVKAIQELTAKVELLENK